MNKLSIEHPHFPDADNVWIDGNVLVCQSETEYDGRMLDTTSKQKINHCPMCGKKIEIKNIPLYEKHKPTTQIL